LKDERCISRTNGQKIHFSACQSEIPAKINELTFKNINLSIKDVARLFQLLFLLFFVYGCGGQPKDPVDNASSAAGIPILNYSVRHVYSHDTTSYTEGLLFYHHQLFESSGATEEYPQTRSMAGVEDMNMGKIDPATGQVLAKLDLTSLIEEERNKNPAVDFLNGIAYDPDADKIYVTGKLWSRIYEIAFSH
jgi:glutamine cyclotransferase